MEITRDHRMEKLSTSPPPVQHLYVSEEAGAKYREIFNKHNLLEAKYDDYVLTVGDVVLGFYPVSELQSLLVNNAGISEEKARDITAELVDYITPILERGSGTVNKVDEKETSFIPTSVTYGPLQEHEAQTTGRTAQQESGVEEAVKPVRTMEEDMDSIHGYGAYRKMYPDAAEGGSTTNETTAAKPQTSSEEEKVHQSTSQDEVLNKRPPLTGTPSYDQPPQQ